MRPTSVSARVGAAVLALSVTASTALARSPLAGLFGHRPAAAASSEAASPTGGDYATSWDEYQAMRAAAHGGRKLDPAHLPNWRGLWNHERGFNFDPDQTGSRATAKLTPEYARRYEEKLARVAAGKEWDPLSACLPAGYPRWLVEPFLREFIVTPDETWLINEQDDEIRRVYTDGRGHMPEDEAYPLWEGNSIGFWDGDTLVVHTNHLRAGAYQRLQPDYSDQVSTVERIRKIGPDMIEDVVTVYDPPALAKPWHVRHTYGRVTTPGLRINQWVCEENNNVVPTADGSSTFILPGEPGYKDPNKIGSAAWTGNAATAKPQTGAAQ